MAAQGERIAGGFILIIGIDGTRYVVRQQAIQSSTTPTSAGTKQWSRYMEGMSCAYPARGLRLKADADFAKDLAADFASDESDDASDANDGPAKFLVAD